MSNILGHLFTFCYSLGQFSWIQCTMQQWSAYGDSNKLCEELSWFHLPLEKPDVVRRCTHIWERITRREFDTSYFTSPPRRSRNMHEGSYTYAKKNELSWSHFPLENPEIVGLWTHNCERAKNRTRHILGQSVKALSNKESKNVFWGNCCFKKSTRCEFLQ